MRGAKSEPSGTRAPPSRDQAVGLQSGGPMRLYSVGTIAVVLISLAGPSAAQEQEPKLNQPTRPGTARSADIQRVGVLQVELGVEGRLHSPEVHSAENTPLSMRYAVLQRLALDANIDALVSEVNQEPRTRHTAIGDTVIGGQWVARDASASAPAVAIAYLVKVPTASNSEDVGTGRVDHRVGFLASKKVGDVDLDVNVAYLNVGQRQSGRASGAFAAISASGEFRNKLGYIAEWSHQTEDAELPRGGYALGALTYRLTEAARFDVAARLGLTTDAPHFSVTAGLSVSRPLHLKP